MKFYANFQIHRWLVIYHNIVEFEIIHYYKHDKIKVLKLDSYLD